MRDGWTDERMDDFRDEVNRRFDEVDKRFDKVEDDVNRRFDEVDGRFDKVDREFGRVHDRLDSLYRAQFMVGGGIIAALIGGFAAVVATQL
jgi:hypothetical protein